MSNIPSVFMPADDCSSFKKRVSNLTKKMVVTVEAKLLLSVYDCSDIYGIYMEAYRKGFPAVRPLPWHIRCPPKFRKLTVLSESNPAGYIWDTG